jgi:hypothetical protein
MKVIGRWKRLEKPRGGFRFGLFFCIQIEYGEENLGPDWSVDVSTANAPRFWSDPRRSNDMELGAIPLCAPNNSRLIYSVENAWGSTGRITPETTFGGKEVYFDSLEEREEFIAFLRKIIDEISRVAQDWWAENPPVPGDEEESVLVVTCDLK